MDAAQALGFIIARLKPDKDPVLSPDDVTSLLFMAATTDVDGLTPDDEDWTPTYNTVGCYRSIAEGWSMKETEAVGRFDFTTDGQMFRRSQQVDQIRAMRSLWARKVQQSPSTLGATP